ncbi:MAG: hypothetical protein IJU23_02575 [Proteobacteria bacterium]|nr:hypothetical protein [Pseudomonadota bacterium]
MRKCPNCKKPVPVGIARCLYCQASLASDRDDEENVNSFRGVHSGEDDEFEPKAQGGRARRATMIGLGAISLDDAKPSKNPEPQRTIVGMPGISADLLRQSNAFQNNKHSEIESPRKMINPAPDDDLKPKQSGSNNTVSSQVEPAKKSEPVKTPDPAPKAEPAKKVDLMDGILGDFFDPLQGPVEDDDILKGLPGVAPVPSSLMDEEVVDLTSQLFGDDFAAVKDFDDDDDDDGFDFDIPAFAQPTPAKPAEPVKAAEPVKQTETAKVAEVVKPAEPVKTSEPAKTSVKAVVPGESKKTESGRNLDAVPQRLDEKPVSSTNRHDWLLIGCVSAVVVCMIVCIVLPPEHKPLFMGLAFLIVTLNFAVCLLNKSQNVLRAALLGVGAVIIVVLLALTKGVWAMALSGVLLGALLVQLGAAVISFFKSA